MHEAPCPEQVPSLHWPPSQVSVEQHWPELAQALPLERHWPPLQTPPSQVAVPQHSLELEQRWPADEQLPPLQTPRSQVSVSQQSPELEQRWPLELQDTVTLGSTGPGGCGPPPMSQASGAARKGKSQSQRGISGRRMREV